ncbi:MarR family winged helix-turn-helix transcriptional regulator [Actinomycetospora soli]|uniref:MarR family winged helix-turn-helix transcriptional regulator n=1 Tax=Actinomycetospora soli TaxID=2893887 RepID=UPI001E5AB2EF|nr:MarR family transcriptional regulator [Actinomycetospora soli]MCD2189595.1 MarR family transcriptional regulator [Actinomycetospora soli]
MGAELAAGSLAVTLHRTMARVAVRVEEITGREGVLLPQWLVLTCLAEAGDLAMGELVAGTGLNDSTLTRVVDRLATSGLVYRAVDPEDRRRVRVSLADRGRTLHDRLAPDVEAVERELAEDPTAVHAGGLPGP